MTTTYQSTRSNNLRLSDESRNKSDEFNQIADLLPDKPIFTKCGKDYAGSVWTNLQKNPDKKFHEPGNLLSKQEAKEWIAEGGNIGIATGRLFDGIGFVNFDIDNSEALEGEAKAILEGHSLFKENTKHDNTNYIVQVDNQETIDLLDAYPTTLTHLTDDDGDDIEIFANEFHAVIPPSEVQHSECSDDKPCNGIGTGTYTLESINRNAEPLHKSTGERLGELWGIEPERNEPAYDEPDKTTEYPSVEPKVNVITEFENNVPHVNTSDEQKDPIEIFQEREEFMKYGDWEGQSEFIQLWNGDFSSVSGSNPQGPGEERLANKIGFFWGRNEELIKYFMSTVPFQSHYQQYPSHRKDLLEKATDVDWCYCEGVRFETKLTVAAYLWGRDSKTVNELADETGITGKQVRRVLDVLEAEGLIDWTHGKVVNDGITHGYISKLERVCDKYEDNIEKKNVESTNVEKVRI